MVSVACLSHDLSHGIFLFGSLFLLTTLNIWTWIETCSYIRMLLRSLSVVGTTGGWYLLRVDTRVPMLLSKYRRYIQYI